ncbi:MAG: T9SS type A sorting domain-containing protein, partial [Bacteroidetes bacterium]|nr:T9SS type A sorting domain-containing protein [Bacteroidota bacterium]
MFQWIALSDVFTKPGEELTFILTDLSGRQLRADRPESKANGLNAYVMNVTGVQPGAYFMTVSSAATKTVTKITYAHQA